MAVAALMLIGLIALVTVSVVASALVEFPHWLMTPRPNQPKLSKHRFKKKYGPYAVVAGASEGLGEAWCLALAKLGLNLVMIARNSKKLEATKQRISAKYPVKIVSVPLDLASTNIAERVNQISEEYDVGFLVYNAAYSNVGDFLKYDLASHLKVIDVNIRSVVTMVHTLGNKMKLRGGGGVVVMSSLQGEIGCSLMGSYAPSKAWNTRFAQAAWDELSQYNIDVLGMVCGPVLTPSYEAGSSAGDRSTVSQVEMHPDQVVKEGLSALGRVPTVAPGIAQKLSTVVLKLLPSRLQIYLFGLQVKAMFPDEEHNATIHKSGLAGVTEG